MKGDYADGERRRERQADREQPDRPDVAAQVDVAALQARRPQQRGQDHEQHQVGLEFDALQTGDRAGQQARDHQGERRRNVEAAGHAGQEHGHHEHREQ